MLIQKDENEEVIYSQPLRSCTNLHKNITKKEKEQLKELKKEDETYNQD
jgi:hypothetical protein